MHSMQAMGLGAGIIAWHGRQLQSAEVVSFSDSNELKVARIGTNALIPVSRVDLGRLGPGSSLLPDCKNVEAWWG